MLKKMKTRRIIAIALAAVMALSTPIMSFAETSGEEIVEEVGQEPVAEEVAQEPATVEMTEEPVVEEEVKEPATEAVITPSEPEINEVASPSEDTEKKEETVASPSDVTYTDIFEQEQNIDNVIIKVKADMGVFPDGSKLLVTKVTNACELEKIVDAVEEKRDENKNVLGSYAYDIKVLYEDEEIEPNGEVSVSFALAEVIDNNSDVNIYHIKDYPEENEILAEEPEDGVIDNDFEDNNLEYRAEELNVEKTTEENENDDDRDAETVLTVETDSFSYYVVEFTYNNLLFGIYGGDSTKLSHLQTQFSLNGTITNAYVSSTECLEVKKDEVGDDWTITAKKTFDTEEWLKIVIGGKTYEITVTNSGEVTDIIYWIVTDDNMLVLSASDETKLYTGKKASGYFKKITDEENIPWRNYISVISKLSIGKNGKLMPRSTAFWFYGLSGFREIDLTKIDTSAVTDMSYMFYGCRNLTSLDMSTFDTSEVTNMSHMFFDCQSLLDIDVARFDTSAVTDMSSMFENCTEPSTIVISGFDTSKVTNMSGMFANCNELTRLDISNFDTSEVKDMSRMFCICPSLADLNLSVLDTSNVTDMSGMFYDCTNLRNMDVSSFDTSKVTSMKDMFGNCPFSSIDVSNFDTSAVTDMSSMFSYCKSLTVLGLNNFDTSRVTNLTGMFYNCNKIKTIYVSDKFVTDNVQQGTDVFRYCNCIVGGNGTRYNENHTNYLHARIDTSENPGYFTGTTTPMTITWNAGGGKFPDGSVSTMSQVECGTMPIEPSSPSREATAEYTYVFSGWTPDISIVTGEKTYTAQYSSTKNKYKVTFKNYDGTVLQSKDEEYGTIPSYNGATPTRPDDSSYHYTFSYWSPFIDTVTGPATYTAKYSDTPLVPITAITFNSTSITLKKGSSTTLVPTVTPVGYTDTFSWWITYSSPTVATVDQNGLVTAINEGTVNIMVKARHGVSASIKVIVTSGNTGGSSGGGGGGGGGGGSADGPSSGSSGSGITGSKAATTPVTVAANGTQVMGSSVVSKPLAMLTAAEQKTVYGKGGQAAWVTSGGHYQFKDAAGNLIKNRWALISDNLSASGRGNVSSFYFDENGNMLLGWQWIKDADGLYRQYFLNNENGSLLGACLLGGTKDGKTLNEKGQVVVNGVVQAFATKPAS